MTGFKIIECNKGCGRTLKVAADKEGGTCWYCTMTKVPAPILRQVERKESNNNKPKKSAFQRNKEKLEKELKKAERHKKRKKRKKELEKKRVRRARRRL